MSSVYNGEYCSCNAIFVPSTKCNVTIPIWVSTRKKKNNYPSARSPNKGNKMVMFLKLEKEKRKRKLTLFAEVCSFQGGDPCSGEKSSPNREQTHSISIRNISTNVFPFTYFYVDNLTTGKVKHTIIYQL